MAKMAAIVYCFALKHTANHSWAVKASHVLEYLQTYACGRDLDLETEVAALQQTPKGGRFAGLAAAELAC